MRQYAQWVVWRYEESDGKKPTKVPYNAATGIMASVTNPATWCDYNQCVVAVQEGRKPKYGDNGLAYAGIGFVLTRDDPYTIIDLDDCNSDPEGIAQQIKIFEHFDSYSERSPSGTGLHIIIRGSVPSGRRRGKVEIYHSERFMTMTGDVFADKPIVERQEFLTQLWHEMGSKGGAALFDGNSPQLYDDATIIDKAMRAVNGPKFKTLNEGDWTTLYGSQSEADFAYVDIIAFYTQNREQIARIFRASPLGQRDKARRDDYVAYMISKAFDRMLPPVNFDSIYNAIESEIARQKAGTAKPKAPAPAVVATDIPPPPGLVGEIAQYIYAAAPRPVPEIALVGAIGLMAGICGRAWNVSSTGLNQYVFLLAPTGTGKEAIARGISRIVAAVGTTVGGGMGGKGTFADFIGPAEMASGQALLKELGRRPFPSFVSTVGEIGLRLKSMSGDYVSPADTMLKRAWLDLYNKSGATDIVQPSIYSDRDKGTGAVLAPAYSMIGESTPETFYGNLSEAMIVDGLLPRFTIVEYYGKRPPPNENMGVYPSPGLVERISKLAALALANISANAVTDVPWDTEAKAYLDAFNSFCDDLINNAEKEVSRQLWSRAHMKVLKLSALIAVGVNPEAPIITMVEAEWARQQVERDVKNLLYRFEAGTIGFASSGMAGEDKQVTAMLKKIKHYLTSDYHEINKYGVSVEMHRDKVIPFAFLSRTLTAVGCFANDKQGPARALQRTLQTLIDNGDLQEAGRNEIVAKYQFNGKCYVLANVKHLAP